eukprot:CAMPEP_0170474240 /NCGR_PEP_ID=MMETSP0123-20130129/16037_1 /TAXON_ID=182087 /ORGANISM="Favella ehrenbergii, Strain Fehren 1" /LENGTH=58 /DNA_ID=CAMNT_0010743845 /DNA_START=201 /DNA_END=374 /DNA_ORIENTATION=+
MLAEEKVLRGGCNGSEADGLVFTKLDLANLNQPYAPDDVEEAGGEQEDQLDRDQALPS